MELIALTSALHPEVFSTLWVVAVLFSLAVGLATALRFGTNKYFLSEFRSEFRSTAAIWGWAFGPLLLLSFASALIFNLKLSRIEVLEVVAGGLILSVGMIRFRPRMDWLVKAAIAGSVIALGVAGVDLFITQTHRAGLAFHPINYGIAVGALCIVLGMYWIRISNDGASVSRNIVGIGLIAGLTALILSGSRGPILSVFVVLGFSFLIHARKRRVSPGTKKILAAAIGFAVIGIAVMVARSVMEYQSEPHHSLGLRAQILSETLQQIMRTPWFGLGIDQAGEFYAGLGLPTTDVNHAHNSLLNAVLEMGILGGLAFLWVFFTLARRFYQRNADYACQLALAILGFFFLCSMTQDILSHSFTRKLLAFYLAMLIVWVARSNAAQGLHGRPAP